MGVAIACLALLSHRLSPRDAQLSGAPQVLQAHLSPGNHSDEFSGGGGFQMMWSSISAPPLFFFL